MCVLLFGACAPAVEQGDNRIDIASAFSDQQTLKASDYFSKVRYVALETTDESVIGNGANITILDDQIMVTTAKQCLLFDKQTGRFLATVGHQGEDPEGYRNANGWVNPLTQTICLDSWHRSLCMYDLKGQFQRKFTLPEGMATNGSFVALDRQTTVAHTSDFLGEGTESVQFFTEDSVLHTLVLHEQDQDYNAGNIASISVLRSESNREVYGTTGAGVIMLYFKDAPGKAYIHIMNLQRMWALDNRAYLKTEHNDTIYRVNGYALEPAYLLDLGKYHWPYAERFNTEHDHALMVTQILDSRELMILRLVQHIYTDDKRKAFNAMYDKTTGEVRIGRIEEGILDDLSGFLPLRPETISPRGEYAGLIEATAVVEWFEKHGSAKLSPQIEHLKRVDEEDNPVIVLIEK